MLRNAPDIPIYVYLYKLFVISLSSHMRVWMGITD